MSNIVEILDGMMGAGKTRGVCKWMDEQILNDPSIRFFYVSPLLEEVKQDGRIQDECQRVKFVSPESKDGYDTKRDHLLKLLQDGINISCTHSLYLNMSEDHFKEMESQNYVLIIDEEIGMITGYRNYSQADCDFMIDEQCIEKQESDGMLKWIKDSPTFDKKDHKYHDFKRHVENGLIYACKNSNSMMVTQLPVKLLDVAKRVIIITYLFEGNVLSSFLKLKGIHYKPFTEIKLSTVSKENVKSLVRLHQPRFFRQWKFMDELPLTYTWYSGYTSKASKRITRKDCDDIAKYIRSVKLACKADWDDVLYTFPKMRTILDEGSSAKIRPEEWKKPSMLIEKRTWLASNTRATNELRHKWCLIHCYNRYPTQSVMQYLKDYGVQVDNDVFAISEMLQWIWRSRIRSGKDIYLAIASPRMKLLFLNWLHDLPLDNKDYSHFAKYLKGVS